MNKGINNYIFPLIAFLLHQYATFCRIGLTHDSHYFLAAANSFAKNYVFLNPDHSYFTNWTPLFPVILSVLPNDFLGVFQGIILLITLIIFQKMAFEHIKRKFFQFFFSISLCFSPYLMLESVFLWSEAVFVLILVLHFKTLQKYLQNSQNLYFFLMIFMSFLLCLQRHAGIFFVFGTFAYLVFFSPKKAMKYVLYLILALSGWFFWLFRNALLALPLPSITTRVFEDLGHNLTVYSDSFSLFFLPTVLPFEWRIGIFCLLILLIFAYFAYKIYKMPVRVFKIVFAKLLLDQTQTLKYGVHIFLYLSAMICLEKANFWEVERYLAIIYPFVFFNLTIFLEQFLTKKVFFQKIVCLILLFWLCYPVIRTVKNIIFWHDEFCRLSGFI